MKIKEREGFSCWKRFILLNTAAHCSSLQDGDVSQVSAPAPMAKFQTVANWFYRQYKMIGPLYKRDKEKVCPLTINVMQLNIMSAMKKVIVCLFF